MAFCTSPHLTTIRRGLIACVVGLLPSACTLPAQQLALPGPITGSIDKRPAGVSTGRVGTPMSNSANPEAKEARTFDGTDSFMGGTPAAGRAMAPGATGAADGVMMNLAGATIPEAAKTVLGDTLGLNYSVSDSLKGSITLRTAKPIARKDLLATFETLLRAEGAVIQVENGIHRILPADAASNAPLRRGASSGGGGISTDALALRHVTPDDMQRLIQGMVPQGAKLTGDASRNLLMVSGTSTEIASVREVVAIFDVDWMRGMSFGLFPVESGDPETIAQELDTIFANDRSSPTKGIVRFVPNRRLKSVLVVTSRREYLDKAEKWLKRIDLVGQESEKQVNVYRVQNRPAAELAQLLQKVYGQQRDRGGVARTGLPPGTPAATLSSDANTPVVAVPVDGRASGAIAANGPRPLATPTAFALPGQAVPAVPAAPAAAIIEAPVAGTATPPGAVMDDRTSGIEITSDDTNNALIITASSREYKRIRNILSRIDVAPPQVLLEATIAEVTLNDKLQQGVRWFFEKKSSQFTLTDSVVGAIAPKVPGFSYFLNTSNIQVALSALSDITDVNIVSSPSMVVLDNKLAQLQIGDEVPIATQSAVSVLAPGSPIVNSVAFRSTGVILNITPHIGDNGRIMLDIEQEVSDVVPTTSSTIDSPTIQQRRIKTKVAVGSGEVIVLAGFIQDRARKSRQQVPLLGNIPILGNLFKDKTDEIRRTELMIAITPHIVQDAQQLRAIASEFRDRMNFTTRPQRTAPPDRREQIDRTLVR